jgi:hypothetical protein
MTAGIEYCFARVVYSTHEREISEDQQKNQGDEGLYRPKLGATEQKPGLKSMFRISSSHSPPRKWEDKTRNT